MRDEYHQRLLGFLYDAIPALELIGEGIKAREGRELRRELAAHDAELELCRKQRFELGERLLKEIDI